MMKKLLIAIALLSVCVCNAKADKHEEQEITQPPQLSNALDRDITYDKWCDLKKNKIPDLQKRIDWYKEQATAYVDTLIMCCKGTTSLDKFDTENAKKAIKKYEEGAGIVAIINPRPEFDAEAEIPALKKRIEVAAIVQEAYEMLENKYTTKDVVRVDSILYSLSEDDKLTKEMRDECIKAGKTLATDVFFRKELTNSLSKLAKNYDLIPNSEVAAQARDELINGFVNGVNKKVREIKEVPESFAFVHDIIKRMTTTLTNYTDSLNTEAKFKKWIDEFLDQLHLLNKKHSKEVKS